MDANVTGNAAVINMRTREYAAAGVSIQEAVRIEHEKGEGWVAINLSPAGLKKALARMAK